MGFFNRLFQSRYGPDKFSLALLWAGVILSLVNGFFMGIPVVYRILRVLVLALYIFGIFRMFSRNTGRRFQENQVYLRWRFYVGEWFRNLKFRIQERRRYKIFKCPGCGQKIRIPRGHGKIQIRCRKCGREFFGRS